MGERQFFAQAQTLRKGDRENSGHTTQNYMLEKFSQKIFLTYTQSQFRVWYTLLMCKNLTRPFIIRRPVPGAGQNPSGN